MVCTVACFIGFWRSVFGGSASLHNLFLHFFRIRTGDLLSLGPLNSRSDVLTTELLELSGNGSRFPGPILGKGSIASPVQYWVKVVYVLKSNTGKRF